MSSRARRKARHTRRSTSATRRVARSFTACENAAYLQQTITRLLPGGAL